MPEPALSAAAATVRRADPDRFLCTLFAPAAKRETLFLLYAFNHELARAREVASQPMLALIRLQWWREVVEGAAKRHELATPLREEIEAGRLDRAELLAMIAGREAEADESVPTLEAWREYVRATGGALAAAAARALGAGGTDTERARAIGTAYTAGGQIRSLGVLARHGRCLLPEDLLAEHGLDRHRVIADPGAPALHPVRAALVAEASAALRAAQGRFPRAQLAAALPAVFARRDLARPATPPAPRGIGERLAVVLAAMRARV